MYFPHHWYRPDTARFGPYSGTGFDTVRDQIGEYLAGERQEFDVPLAANGDELTRSGSGRSSATSLTARPPPTASWLAGWETARPLKRSAPPSAGTLCASSSRAIESLAPAES